MAFLLRMERLARDRSAVTRVMEILWGGGGGGGGGGHRRSAPQLTFSLTSKNTPGSIASIDWEMRPPAPTLHPTPHPCKDFALCFSECVNDRQRGLTCTLVNYERVFRTHPKGRGDVCRRRTRWPLCLRGRRGCTDLLSNRCLRKSNSAFCIMSVT